MNTLLYTSLISMHAVSQHDLIFLFDNELKYADIWSKSPKNLLHAPKDIYGKKIVETIPGDIGQTLHSYVESIFATKKEAHIDYELETLAGKRWFTGSGKLISIDDNLYVLVTCKDITHIKNFDDQESPLILPYKESMHEDLQREKLKSIGELASGLGHEINNPLTIIFGYLNQMQKGTTDETQLKLIEKCISSAERIKNIVEDVKELYPNPNRSKKIINVSKLTNEIYTLLHTYYEKENINFNILTPMEDLYTAGNPTKFQQCIFHLLANAKNAIEENDGVKMIEVSLRETADNHIEINIKDNGCGIDPKISSRIYDAFFTTHIHRDRNGMGLSITYNILKIMKGEIFYKDNADGGVTFTMRLPKENAA